MAAAPAPLPVRPPRVFLTGASSGIGAALAAQYAAAGASLGLVARRVIEPPPAVRPDQGIRVYQADVTDPAALQAAARDFMASVGLPDIVIANAGISAGTLTEHTEDRAVFQRIFATNVLAAVDTFQPFIAPLRAARRGAAGNIAPHPPHPPRLVGIASVAGVRGLPGAGAYSASKAALINYCESLRLELAEDGIAVVTIMPGFIATPMTAHNPYRMPFLMPVERFATLARRAIARGQRRAIIPWQMALVARLMTVLPGAIYDRVFVHTGRKPRLTDSTG